MGVAFSSPAAFDDGEVQPVRREIEKCFLVRVGFDDCTGRDSDNDIFPVFAGFIGAAAVGAFLGFNGFFIFEIDQRVGGVSAYQGNRAAAAAVAAVRAAPGNIFFSPETNAAIAAIARNKVYNGAVDKHFELNSLPYPVMEGMGGGIVTAINWRQPLRIFFCSYLRI